MVCFRLKIAGCCVLFQNGQRTWVHAGRMYGTLTGIVSLIPYERYHTKRIILGQRLLRPRCTTPCHSSPYLPVPVGPAPEVIFLFLCLSRISIRASAYTQVKRNRKRGRATRNSYDRRVVWLCYRSQSMLAWVLYLVGRRKEKSPVAVACAAKVL